MISIRKSKERGVSRMSWLTSYHSFSFNNYYDPEHMGFSDLRVINDDYIKEGSGFGTHSHRDMEIITYVLSGAIAHRDSTGGDGVIRPGEVQRMTAGTGVSHSEFNHSKTDPVHLYQIWIIPDTAGLRPGYEQRAFPAEERMGRFQVIASKDGREGSLSINQNATLYAANFLAGQEARLELAPGRRAWVQIAVGSLTIGESALEQGDGAAISAEESIHLKAITDAEVLVFDLS